MYRPPLRKLNPIWDVRLILRKLEEWGDVLTLSRSRLTHRLAMLLALASARRVSDMFLLCVDDQHLRILPTKWTFLTAFGAKQERQTHSVPPITFNQNVDCSRLCPVAHLVKYMKRTCVERQKDTSHKLFRTTVHPFRPAAKSTIVKWLVFVLSDAGITDSAGSTRAAAATWSTAKGVRAAVIMAAADRSSVRTTHKHYLRLLPKDAISVTPTVQDATLTYDNDD